VNVLAGAIMSHDRHPLNDDRCRTAARGPSYSLGLQGREDIARWVMGRVSAVAVRDWRASRPADLPRLPSIGMAVPIHAR